MSNPAPFLPVYRPNWLLRAFAIFYTAFSCFFVFAFWRPVFSNPDEAKPVGMIASILLLLAGIILTVYAYTAGVRFTVDAVEYVTLAGAKKLPLINVRGRREYAVSGYEIGRTRYLKLESNDDRFAPLDFPRSYNFDDAFYRWFYSLPDLDEMDKKAPKDSNFGLV